MLSVTARPHLSDYRKPFATLACSGSNSELETSAAGDAATQNNPQSPLTDVQMPTKKATSGSYST